MREVVVVVLRGLPHCASLSLLLSVSIHVWGRISFSDVYDQAFEYFGTCTKVDPVEIPRECFSPN